MPINDSLGDRLKEIEQVEAGRAADRNKPLLCRLDGRSFSKLTNGLNCPFDTRFSSLMYDTTKYLVEETHATLAFTASDEIQLYWCNDPEKPESQYMFDGKFQKLTSVLAGLASAYFTKMLPQLIPEKANKIAVFDCRVWNVENKHEAYLNFLWRQEDAIKNSISMLAQNHFSHSRLHGINSEEKKAWLRDIGVSWEDQPQFFRSGTFVQRVTRITTLSPEQLQKIPEQHRPDRPIVRSVVEDIGLGTIRGDPLEIFT